MPLPKRITKIQKIKELKGQVQAIYKKKIVVDRQALTVDIDLSPKHLMRLARLESQLFRLVVDS